MHLSLIVFFIEIAISYVAAPKIDRPRVLHTLS